MTIDSRTRWLALLVLCLGDLMIVLDGTIVNVALPEIRGSLGFSETGLSWVVNAYLLTFGGFLLLGGRAGDLFGRRRVFAIGLALFTLASLLPASWPSTPATTPHSWWARTASSSVLSSPQHCSAYPRKTLTHNDPTRDNAGTLTSHREVSSYAKSVRCFPYHTSLPGGKKPGVAGSRL